MTCLGPAERRAIKREFLKLQQAIEYSRQHYHLPQNVLDVFRELVPEYVEFNRNEVERNVADERNT